MINHIYKFCLIFIFIILFLSFKNQIKILENELTYLKINYTNDNQKYVNKMKHVIGQKLEVTITRAFQNSLEGRLSSESFS